MEFGLKLCDRFAAIAPICGSGSFIAYVASGARGKALRSLGVWAFHGAKDTVVPLSESEKMVAALKKFGHPTRSSRSTPKLGMILDKTYDNPELYQWF